MPSTAGANAAMPNHVKDDVSERLRPLANHARRGSCVILAAIALSGCQARVSGQTADQFGASLQAMSEKLPPEKRAEFQRALVSIAGETGEPESSFISSADPSSPVFFGAADKLRGKTAAEIVRLGYQTQIQKLNETMASEMGEVQRLRAEQAKYKAVFQAVHIDGARYHIEKSMFVTQPEISFHITNGSNIVIKTIYCHGTLKSPGRSVPWIDEDFNTDFAGGLNPGESKDLNLDPNMFGPWSADSDFANRSDLILDVTLVNLDNANGDKLISADLSDAKDKEADIAKKQQEIKAAQTQLAKL